MIIPMMLPARPRYVRSMGYTSCGCSAVGDSGVYPLSCPPWKAVACAAAVAGCLATPDPVHCILAVAPSCLDCLR
jgi:hypothetical protein